MCVIDFLLACVDPERCSSITALWMSCHIEQWWIPYLDGHGPHQVACIVNEQPTGARRGQLPAIDQTREHTKSRASSKLDIWVSPQCQTMPRWGELLVGTHHGKFDARHSPNSAKWSRHMQWLYLSKLRVRVKLNSLECLHHISKWHCHFSTRSKCKQLVWCKPWWDTL